MTSTCSNPFNAAAWKPRFCTCCARFGRLPPSGPDANGRESEKVLRGRKSSRRGPDVHDVLAFAGGPLHREFAAVAGRVVVANLPLDQAAALAHDYDVVHILTERCAHRVAPMALAASDAALVYAKTYDGPAIARMQGVFDHGADESLLSASDAVTFTTLDLAAGYRLPPGRTTILRRPRRSRRRSTCRRLLPICRCAS